MARKFVPQIITANDLFEGDVIYLKADGTWSREIAKAHIANSPEQVETMLDIANGQPGSIVGAYAMQVETNEDGTPAPNHFREEFRTRGPSNYFHGKQADIKQTGA
jgi:hypothetical protein